MTRARRVRARLELELALAEEQDALEAAKAAHSAEPTAESRQAKREAMESFAQTRTWLRAAAAGQHDHPLVRAMNLLGGV